MIKGLLSLVLIVNSIYSYGQQDKSCDGKMIDIVSNKIERICYIKRYNLYDQNNFKIEYEISKNSSSPLYSVILNYDPATDSFTIELKDLISGNEQSMAIKWDRSVRPFIIVGNKFNETIYMDANKHYELLLSIPNPSSPCLVLHQFRSIDASTFFSIEDLHASTVNDHNKSALEFNEKNERQKHYNDSMKQKHDDYIANNKKKEEEISKLKDEIRLEMGKKLDSLSIIKSNKLKKTVKASNELMEELSNELDTVFKKHIGVLKGESKLSAFFRAFVDVSGHVTVNLDSVKESLSNPDWFRTRVRDSIANYIAQLNATPETKTINANNYFEIIEKGYNDEMKKLDKNNFRIFLDSLKDEFDGYNIISIPSYFYYHYDYSSTFSKHHWRYSDVPDESLKSDFKRQILSWQRGGYNVIVYEGFSNGERLSSKLVYDTVKLNQ